MGIFDKVFKGGCSCGSCDVEETSKENTIKKEGAMTIKVLGTGCKNCVNLTDNVKKALTSLNIETNIEKVTDMGDISSYGIMSTPSLVIDEKVVSYGKVLKPEEIVKIIEKL